MNILDNFSNKLPTSYLDYLKNFGSNSQDYYFNFNNLDNPYDGEEYFLYSIDQLGSNLFSKKYKVYEYFKEITQVDYEDRFDSSKLPYHNLMNMFVIGSVNEGKVAIDLSNQTLWIVFMDGFIRKIADSFEEFLINAEKI